MGDLLELSGAEILCFGDKFRDILGKSPAICTLAQREEKFAHEGPVYLESSNEVRLSHLTLPTCVFLLKAKPAATHLPSIIESGSVAPRLFKAPQDNLPFSVHCCAELDVSLIFFLPRLSNRISIDYVLQY